MSTVAPNPVKRVDGLLPVTAVQRMYWLNATQNGKLNHGELEVDFSFEGSLSPVDIEAAWLCVVKQHAALRATINVDKQNQPMFVIRKASIASADELVYSDGNGPSRELSIDRYPTNFLCHAQPEKRITTFVWRCHHAFVDGWSAQIVIEDFLGACNALANGAMLPVSEAQDARSTQRFLSVQRSLLNRDNQTSSQFWRTTLAGYHTPALLSHAASGTIEQRPAIATSMLCGADGLQSLQALSRTSGTTLACTLQLLWAVVLGTLCKQQDIVIGQVATGRPPDIDEIDRVVGCFANVCAVRIDMSNADLSTAETLQAIQHQQFASAEFQHADMLQVLSVAEPACRTGLFDSLLVIQNQPTVARGSADADAPICLSHYESDIVSRYPLTVSIICQNHLVLRLDYDANRFSEQWIEKLQQGMSDTLDLIMSHWASPVARIVEQSRHWLPPHPDPRAFELRHSQDLLREELFDEIVGPSTQSELNILALWEDVLQIRPISMQHRFFDLGGTSLQSVQLLDAIQAQLGTRLPTALFFDNPTPADFSAALARQMNGQSADNHETPIQSLIAFRTTGQHQPALFCLHAGGGHALFYREFAHLLPDQFPCYALQPKGIDGEQAPIDQMQDMAAHYIEEIRKVQPEGPYHLLCYCFGGALLLEMTRQLDEDGQRIGHLIVADAPSPVPKAHPMARFGWNAYLLYEYITQKRWDYLQQVAQTQIQKVQFHLRKKRQQTISRSNPLAAVQSACVSAFNRYRADPTAYLVHFLQADDSDSRFSNRVYMRNWRSLAPDQITLELKGDHRIIFDQPDVIDTAESIAAILAHPSVNALKRSSSRKAQDQNRHKSPL